MIIQTPNSHIRNFSCVLHINLADCSTKGILFDTNEFEIPGVLLRLNENRQLLQECPVAFLSILYADHSRSAENHRAKLDWDVVTMERRTGKTSLVVFSEHAETDYEQLNKALHECNTNLIFLDNITNFEMAVGKFIKDTLVKFEVLRKENGITSDSNCAYQSVSQNMDYLINACEMRRYQAQSLHRRIQTQINVVRDH